MSVQVGVRVGTYVYSGVLPRVCLGQRKSRAPADKAPGAPSAAGGQLSSWAGRHEDRPPPAGGRRSAALPCGGRVCRAARGLGAEALFPRNISRSGAIRCQMPPSAKRPTPGAWVAGSLPHGGRQRPWLLAQRGLAEFLRVAGQRLPLAGASGTRVCTRPLPVSWPAHRSASRAVRPLSPRGFTAVPHVRPVPWLGFLGVQPGGPQLRLFPHLPGRWGAGPCRHESSRGSDQPG